MALLNTSGLGALWFCMPWPPHRMGMCCVVKARCQLADDGVWRPIADQPLPGPPVWVDDDPMAPPLWSGDFTAPKPRVDLLFSGSCNLPAAQAEARVAIQLGGWRKELVVSGERHWQRALLSKRPGPATPFTSLPLDQRHAYGGPELEQNPWGCGHDRADERIPRIEYPKHRLTKRGQAIPPAGFGPVHLGHPRRRKELGTFDEAWVGERWPEMPLDFDPGAANQAPPDQQLEAVDGGEELILENLIPGQPLCAGRLPSLRPRWFHAADSGLAAVSEIPLMLDTIAIDGEAGFVDLVWRAMVPVADEEEAPRIDQYLVLDPAGAPVERHAETWREQALVDEELLGRREAIVTAATAAVAAITADETPWDRARVEAVLAESRDLSGAQLAGLDLSGLDFTDAVLTGADCSGCTLRSCPCIRAVLTRVDLSGADCSAADFSDADLHCVSAAQADFSQAILRGADCSVADFSGANLRGLQAAGAILFATKAIAAQAADAILTGVDCCEADWSQAVLTRVALDRAVARGMKAQAVDARGATMTFFGGQRADWSEADLRGADLHDSSWSGATLRATRLDAASCAAADFTGVQAAGLQAAQIDGARSIWRRAQLGDADFAAADLTAADFWGASCTGLRARGANGYQSCWHACSDAPALAEVGP